jgi:OCT family organic cation transporter-like MFS transporter 4/5
LLKRRHACGAIYEELCTITFLPLHVLIVAVATASVSIYTAELYPTSIRSTVMGLHGQVARAGSIAAPFILLLGQQLGSNTFAPFIIYGSTSLLAGVMLMTMPETLGAAMPETLEVGGFLSLPWVLICQSN